MEGPTKPSRKKGPEGQQKALNAGGAPSKEGA